MYYPVSMSDNIIKESKTQKVKRRRIQKPTIKQVKALQLYNTGKYSMRAALKEAGYGKGVIQKSTLFMKQKGVQSAMLALMGFMEGYGLTPEKKAKKIAEFVDAKKVVTSLSGDVVAETPDYKTQLEGVKMWNDLDEKMRQEENPQQGKVKRQLSITEFVTGEDDTNAS